MRLAAPHLAVVIAAGFAPAAQANRAYGRFDASQENLLTFEHGLVRRVPVPPHGDLDLAFTPDDRLLVATA